MFSRQYSKKAWIQLCLSALLICGFTTVLAGSEPQALVKQTTDKVMTKLKAEQAALKDKPERIYDLFNEIVTPHFDFVGMSRWVMGKYWRKASRDQKKRFIKAFRTLMVRTYGVALLDYADLKIKYIPLRSDPNAKDVTVRTRVQPAAGQPIGINYSLHLKRDAWKIYDVSVDGISLLATFRTSYGSEIRQKGLDKLITKMEEKNTKASQ